MSSNWEKFRQQKKSRPAHSISSSSSPPLPPLTVAAAALNTTKPSDSKSLSIAGKQKDQWWDNSGDEDSDSNAGPSTIGKNDIEQLSASRTMRSRGKDSGPPKSLSLTKSVLDLDKIGKFIAIDCEMVGIGPEGKESALARVSIVNYNGHVIMDKYVRTVERVTDYRTHVSGVTPRHLAGAHDFFSIQKEVAQIIKNRIIIGHALKNDFKALLLEHPRRLIRDTARYKPFRHVTSGRTPSLKVLAAHYLKTEIQSGQHCSVEDARIVLELYKMHKHQWESQLTKRETLSGKRK